MDNCNDDNIKGIVTRPSHPLKKCWKVGENTVVVIDKSLIQRLAISEDETFFEEQVTADGILLRIRKLST